jgi:hypothetical protein
METKTLLNTSTNIRKSYFGWMAETLTTVNGITWKINTSKRHSGVLSTSAQECKASEDKNGTQMMIFSPFSDHSIQLIAERVNCTENAVKNQHYKALTIFEQKAEAGELPKVEAEEVLKVGQIIWLNGYGQDQHSHEELAVYEINGNFAKCVNLDKFTLSQHDHIRPVSKLFGIGMYFTPGDVCDPCIIGEAIKEAKRLTPIRQEEAQQAAEAKRTANEQEKAELRVKYPYLTPLTDPNDKKNITMDNIRAMLKNEFPGIKFSVVHPHYGTVNIRWTDGPTTEQVSKLEKLFQDHHSDETGDYWDYKGGNFNDLFGGMSFVFCNRDMSKETETAITEEGTRLFEKHPFDCHSSGNFIYRIFCASSIPANAKVTGIEHTGENSGLSTPATFYRLSYELSTPAAPEALNNVTHSEGIEVRHNEQKNGIEIRFPGKPANEVLTSLKANGWRWSHFNKVWYNHYTPENLSFANGLI